MKTFLWISLFIIVGISSAQAKDPVKIDVPDGMEVIELKDGFKVLVPKGAKIDQNENKINIETTKHYLLRKIDVLETKLEEMEAKQADMESKIEEQAEEIKLLKEKGQKSSE